MTSELTAAQERSVDLAIRAGRYRSRAEKAEAILADLVTANADLCKDPAECNCPMARAIRHINQGAWRTILKPREVAAW